MSSKAGLIMSDVNIAELRQLTAEARNEVQTKTEKKATIRDQVWALKEEAEIAKVKAILLKLPARCKRAARKGLTSLVVRRVPDGQYLTLYASQTAGQNDKMTQAFANKHTYVKRFPVKPVVLGGVSARLFGACENTGLTVKLQDWHDGVGINGGWEILVSWEEAK